MPRFFTAVVAFAILFYTPAAAFAEISSREFLSSDFTELLRQKDYAKALTASEALLKQHPDDPLILRYRALTLEKLGRRADAIQLYKEIIARHPDYVPARMFLGLTYGRMKANEEAAEQLRWVAHHTSSEEYRHWAQAQLNRLRLRSAKKVERRVYVLGKTGVAYDSNALLVPDNKTLSRREKTAAAQYLLDLSVGYPLRLEKDLRLDVLYIGSQRSHDAGAHDVDFTSQGFALDAKKRKLFGERAYLLGARYDARANFLRSDLFSVVNRFFVSADTAYWKRTRTHFYGRFAVLNFGPDGADPAVASRDGVRAGAGMTQYFYTADLKTFFFVKAEGNLNETRGDNFIRRGALVRAGIHTPLKIWENTALDLSSGFDWGTYPDFISLSALDLRERLDRRWDVYSGVTHKWKPDLATRVFYRYINSENNNDFWDRTRHIAGVEMIFSF